MKGIELKFRHALVAFGAVVALSFANAAQSTATQNGAVICRADPSIPGCFVNSQCDDWCGGPGNGTCRLSGDFKNCCICQ